MSNYSNNSFVEACYEHLRVVNPSLDASAIPRLHTMLAPALESLAQKVGSSPDWSLRNLLRKNLGTVTITSGSGSLASLMTGAQPILVDDIAIRSADIRLEDGTKVQMLSDRGQLDRDRPDSFTFGAVQSQTLYIDTDDQDVTMVANYIETNVANLPTQLIPMLFIEMESAWTRKE